MRWQRQWEQLFFPIFGMRQFAGFWLARSRKCSKMASEICDSDDANFVLNISLDRTEDDMEGQKDANLFHKDDLNKYDEDTFEYEVEEARKPTLNPPNADNTSSNENDAAIANPTTEKSRFFNITDAQLDYLADQTLALSTKDQTKWGVKMFKGKTRPCCFLLSR